jgi:glycosyltransferase involved in cell wall biosynthesis
LLLQISVVIPTCDRKKRLMGLLQNLDQSLLAVREVIVVDSGDDPLQPEDCAPFKNLDIQYLRTQRSVCIQRNAGIRQARGDWIFLCDDDIEVPADYLQKISQHVEKYPKAGAISGLVLQQEESGWVAQYPERSVPALVWKYIFGLGIWGEILCRNNFIIRPIKKYYRKKGNHISRAGWPVITDFSGEYFVCPVYGLGASVVRKEWLLQSPYDELLDPHGIGDNYGVAAGFPSIGIHVLNNAQVYHHQEQQNRLQRPQQYLLRVLALHYFIRTKPALAHVGKGRLLWSLTGNLLAFIFVGDAVMIRPAWRAWWCVARGKNPYLKAARQQKQVAEAAL